MGFSYEISVGEMKYDDAKELRSGRAYLYLEVEMESHRGFRFLQPYSASKGRVP